MDALQNNTMIKPINHLIIGDLWVLFVWEISFAIFVESTSMTSLKLDKNEKGTKGALFFLYGFTNNFQIVFKVLIQMRTEFFINHLVVVIEPLTFRLRQKFYHNRL